MRLNQCPICKNKLKVKKLECPKCSIAYEGYFYNTPILGLSEEQQSFIELFVLSSGSLKEMAEILGVTYPTVRSRLDEIIAALKEEMKQRKDYQKEILEKVKEGRITAEKAAEIIKSL